MEQQNASLQTSSAARLPKSTLPLGRSIRNARQLVPPPSPASPSFTSSVPPDNGTNSALDAGRSRLASGTRGKLVVASCCLFVGDCRLRNAEGIESTFSASAVTKRSASTASIQQWRYWELISALQYSSPPAQPRFFATTLCILFICFPFSHSIYYPLFLSTTGLAIDLMAIRELSMGMVGKDASWIGGW